jgi:hypothetical protein
MKSLRAEFHLLARDTAQFLPKLTASYERA